MIAPAFSRASKRIEAEFETPRYAMQAERLDGGVLRILAVGDASRYAGVRRGASARLHAETDIT